MIKLSKLTKIDEDEKDNNLKGFWCKNKNEGHRILLIFQQILFL